jgi:AraC-like DNA-binding protein
MFQHRGSSRATSQPALLTTGTIMLGAPGGAFECRHEHSRGDRAIAFWFDTAHLESIAADLGCRTPLERFEGSLPPGRDLLPLVTRATAGTFDREAVDWNELAIAVAATVLNRALPPRAAPRIDANATRRVAEIVQLIDRRMEAVFEEQGEVGRGASLSLDALAALAELSPFHFLRTFSAVVGETPHQYVRRARLRAAALRLLTTHSTVLDVALDAGFNDLSAFNRAFKAEFSATPTGFRGPAGTRLTT